MEKEINRTHELSDAELAEQFLTKKSSKELSANETLQKAEVEMQDWYDKEFLPYKQSKEQEIKDFESFKVIIKNHPQEIKHMLGSIFENDTNEAVKTWNYLKFQPAITDMKIVDENLVITDIDDDINEVHLDTLLNKIEMVLGD